MLIKKNVMISAIFPEINRNPEVTVYGKLPEDPVFRRWRGQLPSSSEASDLPFTLSATGGLADGVVTH